MPARPIWTMVLVFVLASGCSSWRGVRVTHPAVEPSPSGRLALRLADGRNLTLEDWRLEGDTLRGMREEWIRAERTYRAEALALSDVSLRAGGAGGADLRRELEARQGERFSRAESKRASRRAIELPSIVRIELAGGTRVRLAKPVLAGDSLRGFLGPGDSAHAATYGLRDLRRVEAYRFDVPRTVGLLALLSLVPLGFGIAALIRNGGF